MKTNFKTLINENFKKYKITYNELTMNNILNLYEELKILNHNHNLNINTIKLQELKDLFTLKAIYDLFLKYKNIKNKKLIYLAGGSGSGKTTLSTLLFSDFKIQKLMKNDELLTYGYVKEEATIFIERGEDYKLKEQFLISKLQLQNELGALNSYDVVFTDSPLFMQLSYCKKFVEDKFISKKGYLYLKLLNKELLNIYNENNVDVFVIYIHRDKTIPFSLKGRIYDEEFSEIKAVEIKKLTDNFIIKNLNNHKHYELKSYADIPQLKEKIKDFILL